MGAFILGRRIIFVRDLAAAAGLIAFSIVIAPFAYYVDEKASPAAPALKLLLAA